MPKEAATDAKAPYLVPYLRAAERHGADFPSLLWASPHTQAARFDAVERLGQLGGKSVLDVGCGRADLLAFLVARSAAPADYIGIEAVHALADAATRACAASDVPARVIRADFLREPLRLFVGADVVVFSGSLNTVDDDAFYASLRRAFDATAEALVFNFLCSPYLAGADYLRWRRPADVLKFCSTLCRDGRGDRRRDAHAGVQTLEDYLEGDFTVAVFKPDNH